MTRTFVRGRQETLVQCLRGLELPGQTETEKYFSTILLSSFTEGLPLPSLRAHLGQDLTQGSCLGGMPRQQ